MPRLESITVSHSILSLTCDRNKAVLKATFSPTSAVWHSGCSPCCLLTVPPAHRAPCSLCWPLTVLASHCAGYQPLSAACPVGHSPASWLAPMGTHAPWRPPQLLASSRIFMAIFPLGTWFCAVYITLSIKSV